MPAGGATVSFQVNRDTETDFDFLFVEARTAGGDDWTTLPDAQRPHHRQAIGACPFITGRQPVPAALPDPGPGRSRRSRRPRTTTVYVCDPVWHERRLERASAAQSDGWETWTVAAGRRRRRAATGRSCRSATPATASSRAAAWSSTRSSSRPAQGSTGFEADGNTARWVDHARQRRTRQPAQPEHVDRDRLRARRRRDPAPNALPSFDRQPEIIAWEAGIFGPYPFSAAGGVVHDGAVGFALENQTRPVYSPFFFVDEGERLRRRPRAGPPVVRRLPRGRHAGNETWLNEGFATYTEWMWGEHEGFFTPQDVYDDLTSIPADEGFWDLADRRSRHREHVRRPDLRPWRTDPSCPSAEGRRQQVLPDPAGVGGPAGGRHRVDPRVHRPRREHLQARISTRSSRSGCRPANPRPSRTPTATRTRGDTARRSGPCPRTSPRRKRRRAARRIHATSSTAAGPLGSAAIAVLCQVMLRRAYSCARALRRPAAPMHTGADATPAQPATSDHRRDRPRRGRDRAGLRLADHLAGPGPGSSPTFLERSG